MSLASLLTLLLLLPEDASSLLLLSLSESLPLSTYSLSSSSLLLLTTSSLTLDDTPDHDERSDSMAAAPARNASGMLRDCKSTATTACGWTQECTFYKHLRAEPWKREISRHQQG
jgi:hypothetical protein